MVLIINLLALSLNMMGHSSTAENVLLLLSVLEKVLVGEGYSVEPGAGVGLRLYGLLASNKLGRPGLLAAPLDQVVTLPFLASMYTLKATVVLVQRSVLYPVVCSRW